VRTNCEVPRSARDDRPRGTQTFSPVRPAELHSAESFQRSGQNVRWTHRLKARVPRAALSLFLKHVIN
jgi:hypothetical protein